MVEYTCPRCGYTTINKSYILKHLERKNICLPSKEELQLGDCYFRIFNCSRKRVQESRRGGENMTKITQKDHFLSPGDSGDSDLVEKFVKKDHPSHPNLTIVATEKNIPFIQAIPRNDRICPGCNKEFSQKNGLYRHKKKSCKMLNSLEAYKTENKESLEEGLGKEIFQKSKNLTQLLNFEKNKQYEVATFDHDSLVYQLKEKDKVIQILSSQIEHLLKEARGNIQLNTTNNDNRITQNNYYILNAFGNEKTDYINKEMVDKFIKEGAYSSISKLVKEIHFHPEHPDNFNVMIPNRKQDLAKVFDGQKWVFQKKKSTLEKMSDKAFYILSQHYEGGNKYMDSFKEEYESEDKNVMRRVHNETELTVLNNQDVIHNPELDFENDNDFEKIKDI